MQATPAGHYLPLWAQYFAFFASLVLGVLKIWESLRHPKLSVALTKETFFRIIDSGEALFCNAILLAQGGPVLVTSVAATLKKTDQPQKTFPLEILQFGEKTKGANVTAEHFFFTSSPLVHIPAGVPQRTVYFCVQSKYRDLIRGAATGFPNEVLALKYAMIERGEQVARTEILKQLQHIVNDYASRTMEQIQIEPGTYVLTLIVQYEKPEARIRKRKMAESNISFKVPEDVKAVLRNLVRQTLSVAAENLLLDTTRPVVFPEYTPIEVVELANRTTGNSGS